MQDRVADKCHAGLLQPGSCKSRLYIAYFNFYTDDAVFTGTDATERWNKKEFMVWAKPFFDRGRAWNFTSIQKGIFILTKVASLAWFDELLNTQMKICRGSGVVA
jgi:hypothetical protein